MKHILSIALISVITLSGCGNMSKTFENRVSRTLDGKHLLFNSMYGPIGVTAKVSDEDAAAIQELIIQAMKAPIN